MWRFVFSRRCQGYNKLYFWPIRIKTQCGLVTSYGTKPLPKPMLTIMISGVLCHSPDRPSNLTENRPTSDIYRWNNSEIYQFETVVKSPGANEYKGHNMHGVHNEFRNTVYYTANKLRNKYVVIISKHHFDVIIMYLLRTMLAGYRVGPGMKKKKHFAMMPVAQFRDAGISLGIPPSRHWISCKRLHTRRISCSCTSMDCVDELKTYVRSNFSKYWDL